MRKIGLVILLGISTFFALSQTTPLSPRIANYEMDIRLDVASKKLFGKTQLLWRNPGSTPVSELQFHLYYNAFKNSQSTFFKESGNIPAFFSESLIDDCGWSWSTIQSMSDMHGNNLTERMAYIQPDDDNQNDQTVLQVQLMEPVNAGDSLIVDFTWEAKIPKTMIRTGYNKDYYFFAQWFPKLGVYEPAGTRYATSDQWNCHQYHSDGEYYADFGVYNVHLTVPNDYVIGSSGSLTNKKENEETTTWSYYLEDVIDFTWTASPHFIEQKDKWNDVDITLLTYPGHEHFAPRYFTTIKNSFEYLEKYVGKYPYKTLTIVDPPIHGLFTGGMEYPTLITTISFCFFPEGFKTTETLVTHEFIHQYFMQMVASHEQEEPWMDEGLTTYYEGRILDHYMGDKTSFVNWYGFEVGNSDFNRYEFFASPNPKIANQTYKARDYKHGGYGPIAYNKTAVWLKTLEGIIGRKTFDLAMKTYFETWKFKHPNRANFIDVFNTVVTEQHGTKFGENLDWFFEQTIFGSDICDYSVASISNSKIQSATGYLKNTEECEPLITTQEESQEYESKVILNRLGEMKFPVEVLIEFENGDQTLEQWNGLSRSHEFSYVGNQPIRNVTIDPERKIWIDQNFLNNSLTYEVQKKGVRKYWLQTFSIAQQFLESLTFLM